MNEITKSSRSRLGHRFGIVRVLFDYALGHMAPGPAVHHLVKALGSQDEDTRTGAYMALVKLGPKISSHLLKEAHTGRQTVAILQILGDLGDPNIASYLQEFTNSPDSEIAETARESLEILSSK